MPEIAPAGSKPNRWLLACAAIFGVGLMIDSYLPEATWISVPTFFEGSVGSILMLFGLLGGLYIGARTLVRAARTTE